MKFNPNYKTFDNVFEVMIDISSLNKDHVAENKYYVSKFITVSKTIKVYNTDTDRLSDKSIYYRDDWGFYFKGKNNKGQSVNYKINELIKL